MKATARKLILTALAVLATGPALAADSSVFVGGRLIQVAELSAEERAWLRDRWQRLPPGERDMLRRELREDWADLPPELRQKQRKELRDRLEEADDRRNGGKNDRIEPDFGYGQGFGTRIWGDRNDDRRRDRR